MIASDGQTQVAVSTKKGGIFHALRDGARLADFGWRVQQGGQEYVTHWWGEDWSTEAAANELAITGRAPSHRETLASPWTHLVLRAISLFAGRRIIAMLKGRMIFKRHGSGIGFSRRLHWSDTQIEVVDTFEGLAPDATPVRAARSSVRHVASADSHHPEDLARMGGWSMVENISRNSGTCTIRTVYTVESGAL